MKQLINPFERIAGWQALFIGLAAMALTAVIGKINNVAFDGVLDVHGGATFSFLASFAMQAVNFLALFLTMWLAGICFSKTKFRAIDVAGTMALSRVPMLALAIICFLPIVPASVYDIPRMIIFMLVYLFFAIWMIALMYNAYTVSCNLKGARAVVSFIGALAVAEILSKIILIFLLKGLFISTPASDALNKSDAENIVVSDTLTIMQKTENVVTAFERGDFNAITVYFDKNMKEKLPPLGLQMAWTQTNMAYGKFERADIGSAEEISISEYNLIEVPFYFQKETLKLRLAFNENGEISGLFFLPISTQN